VPAVVSAPIRYAEICIWFGSPVKCSAHLARQNTVDALLGLGHGSFLARVNAGVECHLDSMRGFLPRILIGVLARWSGK